MIRQHSLSKRVLWDYTQKIKENLRYVFYWMLSKARWCSYNNNQQGLNGPKTFTSGLQPLHHPLLPSVDKIGEVDIEKLIILKDIQVLSLRCPAGAVFGSLSFVVATFRHFWHKDYSMMMCFSPHLHQVFITELVIKLHGLQKQEDLHNNGIEHPQLHIFPDCQGSPERHWASAQTSTALQSPLSKPLHIKASAVFIQKTPIQIFMYKSCLKWLTSAWTCEKFLFHFEMFKQL